MDGYRGAPPNTAIDGIPPGGLNDIPDQLIVSLNEMGSPNSTTLGTYNIRLVLVCGASLHAFL